MGIKYHKIDFTQIDFVRLVPTLDTDDEFGS